MTFTYDKGLMTFITELIRAIHVLHIPDCITRVILDKTLARYKAIRSEPHRVPPHRAFIKQDVVQLLSRYNIKGKYVTYGYSGCGLIYEAHSCYMVPHIQDFIARRGDLQVTSVIQVLRR